MVFYTYVVVAPCTVSFTAPAAVTLDTSTTEREVWGATATEFVAVSNVLSGP